MVMDSRHGPFEHEFTAVRLTRGPDERREPNSLEKNLRRSPSGQGLFVACLFLAPGEGPPVREAELVDT